MQHATDLDIVQDNTCPVTLNNITSITQRFNTFTHLGGSEMQQYSENLKGYQLSLQTCIILVSPNETMHRTLELQTAASINNHGT
jgi:hypothetical protein